MTAPGKPRPGVWGEDARPGEIVRELPGGVRVYNLGASFIPLTGANHKQRRRFGFE